MLLSETLWAMDTRQIAGTIVRDELARQGWKQERAAEKMQMAKSTLARVMAGDPRVQDVTLRAVEGLLHLPRRFLTFVIEGDAERIASLTDMDADLRRHALETLASESSPDRTKGRDHG